MSKPRAILVYKAKADPRTAGEPREIITVVARKEEDDE